MTPVCVYIDGFNLYHALLKFGDNRVKWLDLNALSHRLISPKTEKVQSIFYFCLRSLATRQDGET
jgi:hypothetical protein